MLREDAKPVPAPAPPGIRCPNCAALSMPVLMTKRQAAKIVRVRKCRCGRRVRTEERIVSANDRGRDGPDPPSVENFAH